MKITGINQIYFSPTRTTRKIVTGIGGGLGLDPRTLVENDLTYPEFAEALMPVEPGELVIIGAPVYAGRIAATAIERLHSLTFAGNPAVLVAVYGNRQFEDALIELREFATGRGLRPIAAAAFIGEHSYSTGDFPIAVGRPDREDLKAAKAFGRHIADKVLSLDANATLPTLILPGKLPLPARKVIGATRLETDPKKCNECGTCQTVCPTGAVFYQNGYQTDQARCIICCACVKACRRRARIVVSEHVQKFREMLATTCAARKQPDIFF